MSRKKVCSLYNNVTRKFAAPLVCLADDMDVKYYAVELAMQVNQHLRSDYDFVVIGEFDDKLGIVFNYDDAMIAFNVNECFECNESGTLDAVTGYDLKHDFEVAED